VPGRCHPRQSLGDDAEFFENLSADATDTEFETLEIVDGVDLLAEPAAHLSAGVAGR
jgi:hypothetical protein